jgi:hypothetical protein
MMFIIIIMMWIMYALGGLDTAIDLKYTEKKNLARVMRIAAILLPVLLINLVRIFGV